jgi:hypothetical protein
MNGTAPVLLNALALSAGSAVAALVLLVVFVAPMQVSMGEMSGGHMGATSFMFFAGALWAIVAGAVAGGAVALTYNAVVKAMAAHQTSHT